MEQERYELPDEWEWKQIGELFEVTSSKRVHQKDWKSEGIPFYRTRELVELSKNGHVDNTLFISNEMFNEFKNKYGIPSENDLLVSGVGTIGIPYIVPKNNQFYFKDGNIIWFKNKKNTNAKFIYFLSHSPFVIRQINAFPVGTTVKTYTIVNAKNTWIPLPPLPEQRRIADKLDAVLGRIDDAIRLSQDNLASLDDLFASMLQQAFNPLGKTSKETRYELPDGWEWKKLSDILVLHYGKALKTSDRVGGNIKVYGSNGVIDTHNDFLCSYPTVIIGRKGSVGETNLCTDSCWVIDTAFFTEIKDKTKLCLKYFFISQKLIMYTD